MFSKGKTPAGASTASPGAGCCSPLESLLCRYETSGIEEEETRWPLLPEREGGERREEGSRRVSLRSSTAPSPVKHSATARRPSSRKRRPLSRQGAGRGLMRAELRGTDEEEEEEEASAFGGVRPA